MGVLLSMLVLLQDDPEQELEEPVAKKSFLLDLVERSHVEGGMFFTTFDSDLELDPHVGFYGRVDVPIVDRLYAVVEYRRFDGLDGDTLLNEEVRINEYLLGALYRWDVWEAVDLVFAAEAGLASVKGAEEDSGLILSFTAGVNIDAADFFRIRLAVLADLVDVEFHDAEGWSLNVSGIIGVDFGF